MLFSFWGSDRIVTENKKRILTRWQKARKLLAMIAILEWE